MQDSNKPVFIQLMYFGLFVFIGTVVFGILSFWIGNLLWPDIRDVNQLLVVEKISTDESNYLKFIQLVNQLGMFVFPAFGFVLLIRKPISTYYFFDRIPEAKNLFLIVLLVIFSAPLIGLLTLLNQQLVLPDWLNSIELWMRNMEDKSTVLTNHIAMSQKPGDLWINLLVMALIPAIGEELIFRGLILRFMIHYIKKIHLSVILVAILFSAIHMQFYGFLPRMFLGLILGYLLVWTSSMWAPILFHFTNNAIAVFVMYLSSSGKISSRPEDFGSVEQSWWFSLMIPVFAFLVYYFYKNLNNKDLFAREILNTQAE